jgi:hypothetical protein
MMVVAALAYGAGKVGGELVYARGGAAAFATRPGSSSSWRAAPSAACEEHDE